MSRSDYADDGDIDYWAGIRWSGAVKAAIRGARGQALLRELADALDAMPDKALIACEFVDADGDVCALGALGRARGADLTALDPEDHESVAATFGIADALAREIMHQNDDGMWPGEFRYVQQEIEGPLRPWQSRTISRRVWDPTSHTRRWRHVREWVQRHITPEAA